MEARFRNIVLVTLACVCVACACDRARVIPKGKFSKIYAEMILGDHWLRDNYEKRSVADTSLFYEAIFLKYGYTSEDYRHSVEHYLRNPEEYKRILDKAILEVKKFEIKNQKLLDEQERERELEEQEESEKQQ